jgi:elongation factor 2
MVKKDMKEKILTLMKQKKKIRNMGIIAHIDHGKTTLSDSLVAGAGMMSFDLAGDARWMDLDEEEQQRGITIDTSNVSMVHPIEGEDHLINLIDTPGHVDFGGDVTRAMRAVDGALVLTCAVEGVMPQTETVLRQALKERVKPILFINKVDRLLKELKLSPEELQERFVNIIAEVNKLIEKIAPEEYKKKWQVSVTDGSVGFGTAVHRWAINVPTMKRVGITFADIIKAYETEEGYKVLEEKAPVHKVLLDMIVNHLPDPLVAQKYRIPKIWRGDIDSEIGKQMIACTEDGPLVGCVTKIMQDPHAGPVACIRLFNGKLKQGEEVWLANTRTKIRLQQVAIYLGPKRIQVDEIPCGNIAAIVGMKEGGSGETVTTKEDLEPFEAISHIFEPVVTKSLEPDNPGQLQKLIEALVDIGKQDPTLRIEINQETGEYLISGMGELHLEIWQHRLERDYGLKVKTSPPIVVYRESVSKKSEEVEGKSPNKHNKFYIYAEPLEEKVLKAIASGEIPQGKIRKNKDKDVLQSLKEAGLDPDEAKKTMMVHNNNIFVNATRGIVALPEVQDTMLEGFEEVMNRGPMCFEKCHGIKVVLVDAKLHEDGIHRGPAQVIPAVRDAVKESMKGAGGHLLEPIQKIRIDVPEDMMGQATSLVSGRRGKVIDIKTERGTIVVFADAPVCEMFGFTGDLRSATNGKGFWSLMDSRFEDLPKGMQHETILSIRKRKGMKEEVPVTDYFA